MNFFVFDIETVPDVATGRRLLGLDNLSDQEVADAMRSQIKESTGQTFAKPHLHKIVAISAMLRHGSQIKIWSLGEKTSTEAELIQRFFAGIEKYLPTLVSWNGTGFDLPVLHYRALLHGISANKYWENGEHDATFKYNNYQNRYHTRHLDIMDILAAFQPKAFAPLHEIAIMLGLPGKMGMSGAQVGEYYLQGKIDNIRAYCEIDVLNTYLIFLKFQLIRGIFTPDQYHHEISLVQNELSQSPAEHLQIFLKEMNEAHP